MGFRLSPAGAPAAPGVLPHRSRRVQVPVGTEEKPREVIDNPRSDPKPHADFSGCAVYRF